MLCTNCGKRAAIARGLCSACFEYQRSHGTLEPIYQSNKGATCDECDKPATTKGKCNTHYQRAWRVARGWQPAERRTQCLECAKPIFAQQLCRHHYYVMQKVEKYATK